MSCVSGPSGRVQHEVTVTVVEPESNASVSGNVLDAEGKSTTWS